MSETPRTDAARDDRFIVWEDLAREMERELAAAKAENDSLRRAYVRPDDLREQLAAKTAALERAQNLLALLQDFVEKSPGDPDVTREQLEAHQAYHAALDAARAASPEEGAKA